jgi:uncharacterized delta-60 repeat protein
VATNFSEWSDWWRLLHRLETNGIPEPGFATNLGFGWTRAIAVQPDERILIGGNFDPGWWTSEPVTNNGVWRLQTNGLLDTSFNAGLFEPRAFLLERPDLVTSLLLLTNGRVVVGGSFTNVAGTACDGVARLLPNGAVDSSFLHASQGVTNNAVVAALALLPDGRILVGGSFDSLQGVPRPRLARLDPDGHVDLSFQPPLDSSYAVKALALQSDGKILVGGGTPYPWIGRTCFLLRLHPNGSLDTTFDVGIAGDAAINSLAVESDGNILVAGDFSYWNEIHRPMLVRLFGDTLILGPPELRSGGFQMEVSNFQPGIPVVLTASTNLVHWEPVQTNLLPQSPLRFLDPDATRIPRRFFRAMQSGN